jgi:sugar phosphate isomerase/epimerase
MDFEERLQGLEAILKMDRLANLHVYQWQTNDDGSLERRPLSEGTEDWNRYFQAAKKSDKKHYALLEFARDDSPAQFIEDAKTLTNLIN